MSEPTAKISARYLPMLQPFIARHDHIRRYLTGFLIEPNLKRNGGGVILVATDGHRMIAIHDAKGEANQRQTVRPPRGMVNAGKQGVRFGKKIFQPDHFLIGGLWCQLIDEDGELMDEFCVERPEGRFPDWRAPFPDKMPAEGAAFSANPRYLGDFHKLTKKNDCDPMRITKESDEDTPLVISIKSLPEAVGLVMPMAWMGGAPPPDSWPAWIANPPKRKIP